MIINQVYDQIDTLLHDLLPAMLSLVIVPVTVIVVKNVFNLISGGSAHYSSYEETKQIIDFEKIQIKGKELDNIHFSIYVKYLKKQNFIKALFVQFDTENYIKMDKSVYKKDHKLYEFTTRKQIFENIKQNIHEPVSQLHDDTILKQFHDSIHYSLASLSQFCEMQDIVNLEQEVNKIGNLIHEIKAFSDEISNSANAQTQKLRVNGINEILSKHHIAMDQLILQVKIFNNTKPSDKKIISLEKE